jgi:hypothetical protein
MIVWQNSERFEQILDSLRLIWQNPERFGKILR